MDEPAFIKRACDRCHAVKERCRWEVGQSACRRCQRLKHDCHLRRPKQKVGRKSRGRRLADYLDHQDCHSVNGSASSSNGSLSPTADQLYESSPEAALKVSGAEQLPLPLSYEVALFDGVTSKEQELLRLCLGAQEAVGRFTIGPSFHLQHQRAMTSSLYSAFPQLKDAFLSCAPVLASHQNTHLPESMEKFCYKKAATAVSTLGSFQVRDRQDVSVGLALGVAVHTFTLCVSGGETLTLPRYALGLLKPFLSDSVLDSDDTSYMICLILAETVSCLYRADVPTLRFECKQAQGTVDRYLGVSYPLLTQLYDLCEINHQLNYKIKGITPKVMQRLAEIESTAQRWEPDIPVNFQLDYERAEIANILTQARCLRLAILLIVHRIRFSYGTQDAEAQELASQILTEIEAAMIVTHQATKCTDLCLMVAALEEVDEKRRWKACVLIDQLYQFSKSFRQMIKQQLKVFWGARDRTHGIYWYHLGQYWQGCAAH